MARFLSDLWQRAVHGCCTLSRIVAARRVPFAILLTACLGALAAVLLWRLCRGNTGRPLTTGGLLFMAGLLPVVTTAIRWAARDPRRFQLQQQAWQAGRLSTVLDYWRGALFPSLLAHLIAACLTARGGRAVGITLLWCAVGIETLAVIARPWWCRLLKPWDRLSRPLTAISESTTAGLQPPATVNVTNSFEDRASTTHQPAILNEFLNPATDEDHVTDEECDEQLPWLWSADGAISELRRQRTPDGEVAFGAHCCELAIGTRTAVVHTVLHPAWSTTPDVLLELSEPDEVAIRVTHALPQGIRWELKLPTPAEQRTTVRWSFVLTTNTAPEQTDTVTKLNKNLFTG